MEGRGEGRVGGKGGLIREGAGGGGLNRGFTVISILLFN